MFLSWSFYWSLHHFILALEPLKSYFSSSLFFFLQRGCAFVIFPQCCPRLVHVKHLYSSGSFGLLAKERRSDLCHFLLFKPFCNTMTCLHSCCQTQCHSPPPPQWQWTCSVHPSLLLLLPFFLFLWIFFKVSLLKYMQTSVSNDALGLWRPTNLIPRVGSWLRGVRWRSVCSKSALPVITEVKPTGNKFHMNIPTLLWARREKRVKITLRRRKGRREGGRYEGWVERHFCSCLRFHSKVVYWYTATDGRESCCRTVSFKCVYSTSKSFWNIYIYIFRPHLSEWLNRLQCLQSMETRRPAANRCL